MTVQPVPLIYAIIAAQTAWRRMTVPQREALVRLACGAHLRTVNPRTERALRTRSLYDGDVTGWGRWVLHVHDPRRHAKPGRVVMPEGALP